VLATCSASGCLAAQMSESIAGHELNIGLNDIKIIKNHQKSSNIIKNHQKSSKIIKHHQKSSNIIKNHQKSSNIIKNHQKSSNIIKNHQKSFKNTFKHVWAWG
jgi:protein subunit release factor A